MSTESLKLQLIERLLRTTDEGLLKKVADLFRSEKSEDENGLTDEHYSIVKERYEEYKRGDYDAGSLFVIGNETAGMSTGWREACDTTVRIPISGSASSLNAASAATVFLYEAARQRC